MSFAGPAHAAALSPRSVASRAKPARRSAPPGSPASRASFHHGIPSPPREGSTFRGAFRTRRAAGDGLEPQAPDLEALRPLRVLVAEDNPNNRRIVAMILEMVEAQVTYAENGQEALDAFAPDRFDVVLMDLQMPVVDGLTATAAIRRTEAADGARRTPVIALSANAMAHHVAEALAAGADAHVAKPISPQRLIETMMALVAAEPSPEAAVG